MTDEQLFDVSNRIATREEKVIQCICGNIISINRTRIFKDGEDTNWSYCNECGRIYAPVDDSFKQYKFIGYPCNFCDDVVPELYRSKEEEEADRCEKCLRKNIKDIPTEITLLQEQLKYAKEQLGESEVDGN